MARDGSGTYNLTTGQPVAINTVIDETVFNTLMTDIALALTNSIAANGETPTTAAIPFTEGITIPTGKAVTGSGTASVSGFQLVSGTVVRPGFATTATAAGTTTLTAASAQIQEFTGTANQTIVLPDVTTLTAGHHYDIINNSTGALTINSSGGNLVQTVNAGARATITCILASGTTAASWAVGFSLATTAAGGLTVTGASLFGNGTNNAKFLSASGYGLEITTDTGATNKRLFLSQTATEAHIESYHNGTGALPLSIQEYGGSTTFGGSLTAGAITSNGGLQTFGANDSAGAGYRLVKVPNI